MADFDYSELDALAADLGKVADNAGPNIRQAIIGTSQAVKKTWQAKLQGSGSLAGLPRAIDYGIKTNGFQIESEVGFNKSRRGQAPLGNVSEFGTPTVTGRGYGLKSLEENREDFERGLRIALEQAEKKAGL